MTNTSGSTTRQEVTDIVKNMPGITSAEICELVPHINEATVMSMIHYLKKRGIVVVDGKKQTTKINGKPFSQPTYSISDNPVPLPPKHKLTKPTPSGYEARIEELKQKIAELEAWREHALGRYPDLNVSETVLKARKLVATELRSAGDCHLADQVAAGMKDATLMMRVALKVLEEV